MTVLMVEDDIFFQKFYRTKFKDNGIDVETAADGEEALQKLKEGTYDIVLLDLVLPKIDGFVTLEKIQHDEKMSKIPVVIFSTLMQDEEIERTKQLGAKAYINKTFFDFENVLQTIRKIVKEK